MTIYLFMNLFCENNGVKSAYINGIEQWAIVSEGHLLLPMSREDIDNIPPGMIGYGHTQ